MLKDLQQFIKDKPVRIMSDSAKSYIFFALQSYLKIEGRVSIWDFSTFGESANVICSLNRAIEYLLKLKLIKTDPFLVYPIPKKIDEYCKIKGIDVFDCSDEINKESKTLISNTIPFKEALKRVNLLTPKDSFDSKCFKDINSLRNSLEHHWDRNEEFLEKVVGYISKRVINSLKEYIKNVLNENPKEYFSSKQLEEIKKLDRAKEKGHSLALQGRFEDHLETYKKNPELCKEKYQYPKKYNSLSESETDSECPICNENFLALWDWVADYDTGPEPEGAFPEAKCLHCIKCHFFVEGSDIYTYLDELEIDMDDYGEFY